MIRHREIYFGVLWKVASEVVMFFSASTVGMSANTQDLRKPQLCTPGNAVTGGVFFPQLFLL
jgi:hypothetical protein